MLFKDTLKTESSPQDTLLCYSLPVKEQIVSDLTNQRTLKSWFLFLSQCFLKEIESSFSIELQKHLRKFGRTLACQLVLLLHVYDRKKVEAFYLLNKITEGTRISQFITYKHFIHLLTNLIPYHAVQIFWWSFNSRMSGQPLSSWLKQKDGKLGFKSFSLPGMKQPADLYIIMVCTLCVQTTSRRIVRLIKM